MLRWGSALCVQVYGWSGCVQLVGVRHVYVGLGVDVLMSFLRE